MHAMFECQAFAGTSAKKRKVSDQTASDESPNVVHVKHEPSLMDISSQATSEAQVCWHWDRVIFLDDGSLNSVQLIYEKLNVYFFHKL